MVDSSVALTSWNVAACFASVSLRRLSSRSCSDVLLRLLALGLREGGLALRQGDPLGRRAGGRLGRRRALLGDPRALLRRAGRLVGRRVRARRPPAPPRIQVLGRVARLAAVAIAPFAQVSSRPADPAAGRILLESMGLAATPRPPPPAPARARRELAPPPPRPRARRAACSARDFGRGYQRRAAGRLGGELAGQAAPGGLGRALARLALRRFRPRHPLRELLEPPLLDRDLARGPRSSRPRAPAGRRRFVDLARGATAPAPACRVVATAHSSAPRS